LQKGKGSFDESANKGESMNIYKISLKIFSGILTPFQADTIFGHLCWALFHREGEKSLQEFLEPFKQGNPPFILSDGFPDEMLPKPLSADFIGKDAEERKDLKKIDFISSQDFDFVRNAERCPAGSVVPNFEIYLTFHNTISRLTNSVLTEGGIYSLKQTFIPRISIYLKTLSENWKERVVDLFKDLATGAYGRKKSIGAGHFSVQDVVPFSFKNVNGANAFVTLSNFSPAEKDPSEGLFKTFVKYGKLGEEFTFCGNPFKRPLVMLRAGSVFRTGGMPKDFYGRIIKEGIAPAKPEVVQYAYAFPVPLLYPNLKGGSS
jgi:CRISPR-associated protein Csm4